MNLYHYATTPSDPSAGLLGCGAHTDYGALTFLLTDEVPGLQVRNCSLKCLFLYLPAPAVVSSLSYSLPLLLARFVGGAIREPPTTYHSNCRILRGLRGCLCHPSGDSSWSIQVTCWSDWLMAATAATFTESSSDPEGLSDRAWPSSSSLRLTPSSLHSLVAAKATQVGILLSPAASFSCTSTLQLERGVAQQRRKMVIRLWLAFSALW